MNKVSIATKPLVYSTFRYISNHVWHAIGEYVDNSIQSYLDHKDLLKQINPEHKLTYDEINKVFACWDPFRTKNRLNEKQYVSFFSRLNLQESVKPGEFIPASLQNDYKLLVSDKKLS